MTGRVLRGAAAAAGTGGAPVVSMAGGTTVPPATTDLGPGSAPFGCGGLGPRAALGDLGGAWEAPPVFLGIVVVMGGIFGGGGAGVGGAFLCGFLLLPGAGSAGFGTGGPFFFGSSLRGALEPTLIWSL